MTNEKRGRRVKLRKASRKLAGKYSLPHKEQRNGRDRVEVLNPKDFHLVTAKQQLFIQEVLADLDVKEAAKRVGISEVTGRNWMRKPHVRAHLNAELENKLAVVGVTSARVMRELASIAFFNVKSVVDQESNPKGRIADLPNDVTAAIERLEVVYDDKTGMPTKAKIIPHNKLKALEVLAKMMSLVKEEAVFMQQNNQTVIDWNLLAKGNNERINEVENALKMKLMVLDSNTSKVLESNTSKLLDSNMDGETHGNGYHGS